MIYLVKYPDGKLQLVSARDELQLMTRVDYNMWEQVTFTEYRGPLKIELDPTLDEHGVPVLQVKAADAYGQSDAHTEVAMVERVFRTAYPQTWGAYQNAEDLERDEHGDSIDTPEAWARELERAHERLDEERGEPLTNGQSGWMPEDDPARFRLIMQSG